MLTGGRSASTPATPARSRSPVGSLGYRAFTDRGRHRGGRLCDMSDFDEPRRSNQIVGSSAKVKKLLEDSIARGTEISERDMLNNEPVRRIALTDIRHWDEYNLQWLRQAFTGDQEWK